MNTEHALELLTLRPDDQGRTVATCPVCDFSMKLAGSVGESARFQCLGAKCPEEEIVAVLERGEALGESTAAREPTSWAPIDLSTVEDEPPPALLRRTDGPALLYPGKVHALNGEPESCKGWLALTAAAEVLAAGGHVLYFDFEDTAAALVGRLSALGVPEDALLDRFHYVRPEEPLEPAGLIDLQRLLAHAPELAVVDGLTEALTLESLDLNSNADVACWLALLPRRLEKSGATVVLIDHVVKAREERGRYGLGASHKLAGIAASYSLEVVEPFGRGRDGLVKVSVKKDRAGYVREHEAPGGEIAELRLSSRDGAVTAALEPPAGSDEAASWRPTVLMERISRAIEAEPGMPKRGVRELKGKTDWLDRALEVLLAEEYIELRREGQAHRHYSLRPFRESDRDPVPPPCPERDPSHRESDRDPVPPPLRGEHGTGHGTNGTDPSVTVPPQPATAEEEAEAERVAEKWGSEAGA